MANNDKRQTLLSETKESLSRMQGFDTKTLPRVEDLGREINFTEVVGPADRLIDLYKQLAEEVLEALPDNYLTNIKTQATSDFNLFDRILKFKSGTPEANKDELVNQVASAYTAAFNTLQQHISYSVRKSTDFEKLAREARANIQSINDKAAKIQSQMEEKNKQADSALKEIRKVAAEHGVSQQAVYFKDEAEKYDTGATKWLIATVCLTITLMAYAVFALLIYKWAWIKPENTYETVQLTVSKILIFTAISFILGLSAKNYLASRHNAVVNKHRQNALLTYEALVKAAGDDANRDIILTEAAGCIFSPQSTAFGKNESIDGKATSMLSIAPHVLRGIQEG